MICFSENYGLKRENIRFTNGLTYPRKLNSDEKGNSQDHQVPKYKYST